MPKKFHELDDEDYEHHSEEIDGKTIYYKSSVSEMTKQEFANLSQDDCEFIFQNILSADTLISKHIAGQNLKTFTAETLDNLIDLWNDDVTQFDCTESDFINFIGSAFGHFLNKMIGSKWILLTDEYGTDYSCQIDEISLRAFPLNSVLKAIEQKRENSLDTIYLMLKEKKIELENDL
jgi:hypothetical protein